MQLRRKLQEFAQKGTGGSKKGGSKKGKGWTYKGIGVCP